MIEMALKTKKYMTYDEAVLYCQFLDYDGHTDWRLPTVDECISSIRPLPIGDGLLFNVWYIDMESALKWSVIPVRDI